MQGTVVGQPPLVAPYSKRTCSYFSAIDEDTGGTKGCADETMIEDQTGRAIVVLAGATIQVDFDHESWGAVTIDDTLGTESAPKRREGILAPGEVVAVYGFCQWERDPSPERYGLYRDMVPQRLRITGTSRVKIWVTEKLG